MGTMLTKPSTSTVNRPRQRRFATDRVIEEFYDALASGKIKAELVHIPKSDVFYARRAYYEHSGEWISLDRMERAMYLEGMLDRKDVFDPDRPREWEKNGNGHTTNDQ